MVDFEFIVSICAFLDYKGHHSCNLTVTFRSFSRSSPHILRFCLRTGRQFYSDISIIEEERERYPDIINSNNLGIPVHSVSNIEIAETTKVVENCHRFLQIAFAEELYLYCQANDINFSELRDALNSKWNVQILEPREGRGGHCIPKDTKMFLQSSKYVKSKILAAAIEVDEDYKECF
jgi:UDP-N-acetyl-D-mannosaminuronic acid dehydrogenase